MTSRPQFDQADFTGESHSFRGTVTTSVTNVPSSPVANTVLSEIFINTQEMTSGSQRLEYSVDGGTTYMQLKKNTIISDFVRTESGPAAGVSQLKLRMTTGSATINAKANLESC